MEPVLLCHEQGLAWILRETLTSKARLRVGLFDDWMVLELELVKP